MAKFNRQKDKQKYVNPTSNAILNLTPRQKRFTNEYIKDFNGSAAALRAGFSWRSAGVIATRLLKNVNVQMAIRDYEENLSTRFLFTKERVLKELSVTAFSDVANYYDSDGRLITNPKALSPQISRAIKKIKRTVTTKRYTRGDRAGEIDTTETVDYELHDKNTALLNMGKEIGMFRERSEISTGPHIFRIRWEDPLPKKDSDEGEGGK
jgi:phage terminase small subunit